MGGSSVQMKGRRPKTTAQKRMEGNTRGVRLKDDVSGPLYEDMPPPTELVIKAGPSCVEFWNRTGSQLVGLGVLTEADLTAFEAFCITRELWQMAARAALDAPDDPGTQRRADMHANRLSSMVSHFGLSPATRGKVDMKGSSTMKKSVLSIIAGGRGEPGK